MFSVLKVLITLAVIVFLLNRKVKMGNAMLAGSAIIFLLTGLNLQYLNTAVITTTTSYGTWEILFALYFVMCLEFQLRTSGTINGLMVAARKLLRSDRILLPLMPAFLGFLPSLGGAIFSAPLVESASRPFNLTPENKTVINYWFRHVWEFTNPIFTGMLLASQLSDIPLSALITNMAWVTALSILIGWLFFISPLKQRNAVAGDDLPDTEIGGYQHIALATGPILANFFLVVFLNLPASISMGLVVAAMVLILKQNIVDIRSMLKHAFDQKLLWGVVGILFFQNILRPSGLIQDIAALLHNLDVPNAIVIGAISFVSGLLLGTSQGFVAITFPFIAVLSPNDISLAMICFVMGTAGHMLSPTHLCLLVTLDYFKADYLKTLRPIFFLEIIMAAAGYIAITII
ncbi:MAG: integral rane protein [Sporomusa sp.]|nr:integral rane protein [Sporomusa sp.]